MTYGRDLHTFHSNEDTMKPEVNPIYPPPTILQSSVNANRWSGLPLQHGQCASAGKWEGQPFDSYWISVIKKGKNITRLHAGQRSREVFFEPGAICAYPSGQHWDHLEFKGEVEAIQAQFEMDGLLDIDKIANKSHRIRSSFACFKDKTVEWLLTSLLLELKNGVSNGHLYVESLSVALQARLIAIESAPPRRANPTRLAGSLAAALEKYIEDRLDTALTIAELSAQLSTSRSHFAACFKETFGQSVHRYVTERRVQRAKVLLAKGEEIAQTALLCGFATQSHFTETFRRSTGQTPATFRRENRHQTTFLP